MSNNPAAEAIAQDGTNKKQCFVIAPIGDEGSDTRKRSDLVLKHIIRKALEPNYVVKRADEIELPGTITVQIVERVLEADLVVADLTERNANVFYELAIRHATKKPSIHIVSSGESIPFDVSQIRAIEFDLTSPDSVETTQLRIREYARVLESGEPVITPIQFAQMLKELGKEEGPDKIIVELLQRLTTGISSIKDDIEPIAKDFRIRKMAKNLVGLSSRGTALPGEGDIDTAVANYFSSVKQSVLSQMASEAAAKAKGGINTSTLKSLSEVDQLTSSTSAAIAKTLEQINSSKKQNNSK